MALYDLDDDHVDYLLERLHDLRADLEPKADTLRVEEELAALGRVLRVLDPEPAPRPRPALPGSIPLPAEV